MHKTVSRAWVVLGLLCAQGAQASEAPGDPLLDSPVGNPSAPERKARGVNSTPARNWPAWTARSPSNCAIATRPRELANWN
jgi:hypothetical protein